MSILVNGEPVSLASGGVHDNATVESFDVQGRASAEIRLTELDQVDPAGRFRLIATADAIKIERAATADWATATDLLQIELGQTIYPDDVLLRLGSDGDGILVLNSVGSVANTVYGLVSIGVPVVDTIPANTLILSNITAGGDIVVLAQTGGNSIEYLRVDASASQLILAHAGQAIRVGGVLQPVSDDLVALGVSGTAFADLFLASGAVINFSASDVLVTHAANSLTVAGGVLHFLGGLVGGNAAPQITDGLASNAQLIGTDQEGSLLSIFRFGGGADGPGIEFVKSLHATPGSHTIVANDNNLGQLAWFPDDGVDYSTKAGVFKAVHDNTAGAAAAGDVGLKYMWSNMPGGGGALRDTLTLDAAGHLNLLVGDLDLGDDQQIRLGDADDVVIDWDSSLSAMRIAGGPVLIAGPSATVGQEFRQTTSDNDQGVTRQIFNVTGLVNASAKSIFTITHDGSQGMMHLNVTILTYLNKYDRFGSASARYRQTVGIVVGAAGKITGPITEIYDDNADDVDHVTSDMSVAGIGLTVVATSGTINTYQVTVTGAGTTLGSVSSWEATAFVEMYWHGIDAQPVLAAA